MSLDSLQLLPVDQWHKLKDVFKKDWPRCVSGFTLLDTMEDIIKHGCDYGFEVYCPYGDVENGMVGINIKSEYIEYIIQCPKETSKLEEALRTTKLLKHFKVEVPFAPKHVMALVHRLVPEWDMEEEYCVTTETFILNKKTPFNVELPPGFTFEKLSLDHVELVDSVWPHRYPTSQWYFKLLTNAKLGYGLFHANKELLSWVYVKEMGALGHLYTLEKHRRKGYAVMTLKLISNILMEQGKTVFAFCVTGNTAARNMYIKMGFDNVQDVDWVGLKRRMS